MITHYESTRLQNSPFFLLIWNIGQLTQTCQVLFPGFYCWVCWTAKHDSPTEITIWLIILYWLTGISSYWGAYWLMLAWHLQKIETGTPYLGSSSTHGHLTMYRLRSDLGRSEPFPTSNGRGTTSLIGVSVSPGAWGTAANLWDEQQRFSLTLTAIDTS